jgi:RNA polymerase sigma-70 factor (ECF subfamily)
MDQVHALAAADLAAALPKLRRFARVLVGGRDGADDLVLATLGNARRVTRGPPPEADLRTWLFGLMHAAHRRHSQRNTNEGQPSEAAASDICSRLLRLPIEEREVLMLVVVERLSYADIAKLLDAPVASVMSTLVRGRERLGAMESAAAG